jgi:tetratricopeptide (TPR) repeat protein
MVTSGGGKVDSDDQRLAGVVQVEALIASNPDAARSDGSREAVLGAAETLLDLSLPGAVTALVRVEKLLNFAATIPGPTDKPHIAWLRAKAYIRAASADDAIDPRQTLRAVWRAFEINAEGADAAIPALLGMAYGHFAIQYRGAPDAPFPLKRADKGLTFAHAYYLVQGNTDRAAQVAFLLAQVKMRSVRRGGVARKRLMQIYDAAWSLISEAVAASDRTNDGNGWARRHEVAADIILARPTHSLRENLDEALTLFHQAIDGYSEIGDRDSTARCAIAALKAIDKAGATATPARAKLSEDILRALEWAQTGTWHDNLQMTPTLGRAAETWLAAAHNADGEEAKDAFEQARRRAQALTTLPVEPDSGETRMIGYFILGNALGGRVLTASTFGRLEAAEAEQVRARLVAARSAFGSAREIAREIGADLYGRTCIQYAKTLSAQFGCCGDESLIAEAIGAWREAVQANADDDRTRSLLNLAGMLLQAVSAMKLDYLSELDQVLEELTTNAYVHRDQGLRAVFEELSALRKGLDEAMVEHARTRVAGLIDLRNKADDVEGALRIASDAESCRRFLAEAVTSAPAHSLARDLMFRGPYNLVLQELELMRNKGILESDPALWQRAVALANDNRAMTEDLIEYDHQRTSSEGGKALLASHLECGMPFVLLLRAFELEVRDIRAEIPEGWFEAQGRAAFPNETMRVGRPPGESAIGRVIELLSPRISPLVIVNINNPFAPPPEAAALFLRPQEWHAMVFCLIAVAKAVVLVLPQESEGLSPGISDEIRAIRELGATDRAVIVLEPKIISLFDRRDGPSTTKSQVLRARLEEQGFHQVFDTEEAFGSTDQIARAMQTLLDSSEQVDGGAGDQPNKSVSPGKIRT